MARKCKHILGTSIMALSCPCKCRGPDSLRFPKFLETTLKASMIGCAKGDRACMQKSLCKVSIKFTQIKLKQ